VNYANHNELSTMHIVFTYLFLNLPFAQGPLTKLLSLAKLSILTICSVKEKYVENSDVF